MAGHKEKPKDSGPKPDRISASALGYGVGALCIIYSAFIGMAGNGSWPDYLIVGIVLIVLARAVRKI